MEQVRTLIVGAGVTGLAAAAFSRGRRLPRARGRPGDRRLLQDGQAGRVRLGLLRTLLPLQAPRDRGLAARAHARPADPHRRQTRSFIAYRGGSSTSPSRRTSTSSRRTSSSTACTTSTSPAPPPGRGAQADSFAEMLYARFGALDRREVPGPLQREALRLRPRHARQGRDGALLPPRRPGRHHPQHEDRRTARATTPPSPIPKAAPSSTSRRWPAPCPPGPSPSRSRCWRSTSTRKVARTTRREIAFERLISSAPAPPLRRALRPAPRPAPSSPGTRCSCSTWASTARARAACTGSTTPTASACSTGSAFTTTSSTATA